jgi:transketolase
LIGLEDLALFRAIPNSVVLYPSDAVSTEKAVQLSLQHKGIVYIRTGRMQVPIIYQNDVEVSVYLKSLKSAKVK